MEKKNWTTIERTTPWGSVEIIASLEKPADAKTPEQKAEEVNGKDRTEYAKELFKKLSKEEQKKLFLRPQRGNINAVLEILEVKGLEFEGRMLEPNKQFVKKPADYN